MADNGNNGWCQFPVYTDKPTKDCIFYPAFNSDFQIQIKLGLLPLLTLIQQNIIQRCDCYPFFLASFCQPKEAL